MAKTKFTIKTSLGSVLFERESDSIKTAIELAVSENVNLIDANLIGANLRGADLIDANLSDANLRGADLIGANLRGADLIGANLRGADLIGANLSDANLRGADLIGANLSDANLRGADLIGANLIGANLRGADLIGANLIGANLRGADLIDANLIGANLRGADLSGFRSDLIAEILKLPDELENLRDCIAAGRIDGSTYEGECACLAGTIANHRNIPGVSHGSVIFGNGPSFKVDASSPREHWFMNIRPGDTPDTNQCSNIALDWVNEAIAMRDNIRGKSAPNLRDLSQ